jgi:hypothetical protein
MADDTTTTSEPTTAPATGEPPATASTTSPQPTTSSDIPPEVTRALHKANKEAETLRLRLKEFEDRDKTDAQKLAERAAAAERTASEAQSKLLKFEVAAEKNIPATLAARLQGSSKEELAADADRLLADLAAHQQATAPSYDGGVRTAAAGPVDMNTLIRQKAGFQ